MKFPTAIVPWLLLCSALLGSGCGSSKYQATSALSTQSARSGSNFFPMTVSQQALRPEWSRGAETGLSLPPLPMLAGLHRSAPSPSHPSQS